MNILIELARELLCCIDIAKKLYLERDFNLTQLMKTPTRHGVHGKTCLDLIFTNMDHIISSGVINIKIMVKKKQKTASSSCFIAGISYANYNKQTFQNDKESP